MMPVDEGMVAKYPSVVAIGFSPSSSALAIACLTGLYSGAAGITENVLSVVASSMITGSFFGLRIANSCCPQQLARKLWTNHVKAKYIYARQKSTAEFSR